VDRPYFHKPTSKEQSRIAETAWSFGANADKDPYMESPALARGAVRGNPRLLNAG